MNDSSEKRVLLVGHCGLDTPRIEAVLREAGATHVDGVQSVDEALAAAGRTAYRLIVGNRVIGFDQEGGLHLTQALKEEETTREIPVLVLSAFAQTQDAVEAAGGERGFGKDEMTSPAARAQWRTYLA